MIPNPVEGIHKSKIDFVHWYDFHHPVILFAYFIKYKLKSVLLEK